MYSKPEKEENTRYNQIDWTISSNYYPVKYTTQKTMLNEKMVLTKSNSCQKCWAVLLLEITTPQKGYADEIIETYPAR